MDSYLVHGAYLVYRCGDAIVDPRRFIDDDIIAFPNIAEVDAVTFQAKEDRQCFRLGHHGSTLTAVEKDSWLK